MISAFLGRDPITSEHASRIFSQLRNPQHCYIKTSAGMFLHRKGDLDNPLRGMPIRFTRVAAERHVKYLASVGVTAEIVEAKDVIAFTR